MRRRFHIRRETNPRPRRAFHSESRYRVDGPTNVDKKVTEGVNLILRHRSVVSFGQCQRPQIGDALVVRIVTRRRRDLDATFQRPAASQRGAPMKMINAFVVLFDENGATLGHGQMTVAEEVDQSGAVEFAAATRRAVIVLELEDVAR